MDRTHQLQDVEGFGSPVPARGTKRQASSVPTGWLVPVVGVYLILTLMLVLSMGAGGLHVGIVLMVCLGGFYLALYLAQYILALDQGDDRMQDIADAIREGAEGFLRIQYGSIAKMMVFTAGGLFVLYLYREPSPELTIGRLSLALLTSASFLIGAVCSAFAGYIGVWVSVRANLRVAAAAAAHNYPDALLCSFRGGAFSSLLSACLCIFGVTVLYAVCFVVFVQIMGMRPARIPLLLSGYGFGASFVALFMQLGGGIYTKAADVGADMVGKVEADIPEDDPRNPAVIADLVGDNVGDCAGSMADVFESIAAEIIGTMVLGSQMATEAHLDNPESFVFFPLLIHSFDIVVSSIGILYVRSSAIRDGEDPLKIMKSGYLVTMFVAVFGFIGASRILLYTDTVPTAWYHFAGCGLVGMVAAYCLINITQYYTDYNYGPVRLIASSSTTGHGTNIIAGISVGMESTGMPTIVIAISLLVAYSLGATSGIKSETAGLFGTAVATMGMLCTAVYVLSMNNFGPIADNAGGIVEMSDQPESVRVVTDQLDAVGNVTKAATKGYAVGGSALACFVLFRAYLDEITIYTGVPFRTVDVAKIEVLVGGLLGIMLIFVFSSWAIAGVGKTAAEVVREVRRQFREIPGIMEGTERPEYGVCVAIVTKAALREMVKPAVFALGTPLVVGGIFRQIGVYMEQPMMAVEVLAAMIIFASLTALLMAMFFDNGGGAWDNAKKFIEAGNHGGKGSEAHKAAVTGDTVGDPFKDTAGPALHVIITTMSTTILVLGPLFVGA